MAVFNAFQLIFVVVILSLYIAYKLYLRYRNFPPGPWGFPIVGYLPMVRKDFHKQLHVMGKRYGSVFSVGLGMDQVVILNDWQSIQEGFLKQSETFSGRVPSILFDVFVDRKDIATDSGLTWKIQRRFALHQLRDFGFGKKSMEGLIREELDKFIELLHTKQEQKVPAVGFFFLPLLNVIWNVAAGQKYEYGNSKLLKMREMIVSNLSIASSSSVLNFFPFLVKIIPGVFGFPKYLQNVKEINEFLNATVEEHISTYNADETRDFTDAYLHQMLNGQETFPFDRERLVAVLANLLFAGTDTSANTLTWGLLYMATWPEIQKKVQDELDSVVGRNRMPSYEDKKRIPYTDATILEIMRKSSIAFLGFPHATIRDTTLMGYHIPKGTQCISNLWACHNNKEAWGDPEVFRPERYLTEDGEVKKPDYLIPFGLGARFCLGEPLARMEIFVFFTCLLHRFTFTLPPGEPLPDFEPIVGAVLAPKPFNVIVKTRY